MERWSFTAANRGSSEANGASLEPRALEERQGGGSENREAFYNNNDMEYMKGPGTTLCVCGSQGSTNTRIRLNY